MTDNPDRDKALKQAYSAATSALRKAHQDEFNEAYKNEAAARGFEVALRPSAEERARLQVQEILASHPEIKKQLVAEVEASLNAGERPE